MTIIFNPSGPIVWINIKLYNIFFSTLLLFKRAHILWIFNFLRQERWVLCFLFFCCFFFFFLFSSDRCGFYTILLINLMWSISECSMIQGSIWNIKVIIIVYGKGCKTICWLHRVKVLELTLLLQVLYLKRSPSQVDLDLDLELLMRHFLSW